MNTTLDIAAALSAVIWPITVLAILLAYRSKVPTLVEGLASRVRKLEFAGISLELAIAKPFVPEWSGGLSALDLRHKATAIQVQDSTARTFLAQLTDEGTGDYAEINLGDGSEWLTSRLFIMAIVFTRMKGIECFVFVETFGGVRKRFVGSAEPEKVRWALAKRFPWLEQAYAESYAIITAHRGAVVVSGDGRLGYQYAPTDPGAGIELLKEFLERAQQLFPPPQVSLEAEQWVVIDAATNTYEHASWVGADALEQWLAQHLHTDLVRSSELQSQTPAEQVRRFLTAPNRFVAVVGEDRRFEHLVRRDVLLTQLAKTSAVDAPGRTPADLEVG